MTRPATSGEARRVARDWSPGSEVPRESMLFCGPDPCWSPARERLEDESRPCPLCGGPDGSRATLVDRADDLAVICSKCGRSRWDGTDAMTRAVKVDDGVERDGWDDTQVWQEVREPAKPRPAVGLVLRSARRRAMAVNGVRQSLDVLPFSRAAP